MDADVPNAEPPGSGMTEVRVTVPRASGYASVARVAAAALAADAGAGVQRIEDARLAVDELCSLLFEHGVGGTVEIVLTLEDDDLTLVATTGADAALVVIPARYGDDHLDGIATDHVVRWTRGQLQGTLTVGVRSGERS